jgi:hypothetical protein
LPEREIGSLLVVGDLVGDLVVGELVVRELVIGKLVVDLS